MQEQTDSSQVNALFNTLAVRLQDVPELKPGFELLDSSSGMAAQVFFGYVDLIGYMAELDDDQRGIIRAAKARLLASNGQTGTASDLTADDLLAALDDDKTELQALGQSAANPASPYYAQAVDELVYRLEGGRRLRLSGKHPSDGDPESAKVIWGHTMISDGRALVHFMVCHYLERFFAAALAGQGYAFARGKDFLLNAMIDAVLLDHVTDNHLATKVYNIWKTSKEQGGLGWITKDRLASYEYPAPKTV